MDHQEADAQAVDENHDQKDPGQIGNQDEEETKQEEAKQEEAKQEEAKQEEEPRQEADFLERVEQMAPGVGGEEKEGERRIQYGKPSSSPSSSISVPLRNPKHNFVLYNLGNCKMNPVCAKPCVRILGLFSTARQARKFVPRTPQVDYFDGPVHHFIPVLAAREHDPIAIVSELDRLHSDHIKKRNSDFQASIREQKKGVTGLSTDRVTTTYASSSSIQDKEEVDPIRGHDIVAGQDWAVITCLKDIRAESLAGEQPSEPLFAVLFAGDEKTAKVYAKETAPVEYPHSTIDVVKMYEWLFINDVQSKDVGQEVFASEDLDKIMSRVKKDKKLMDALEKQGHPNLYTDIDISPNAAAALPAAALPAAASPAAAIPAAALPVAAIPAATTESVAVSQDVVASELASEMASEQKCGPVELLTDPKVPFSQADYDRLLAERDQMDKHYEALHEQILAEQEKKTPEIQKKTPEELAELEELKKRQIEERMQKLAEDVDKSAKARANWAEICIDGNDRFVFTEEDKKARANALAQVGGLNEQLLDRILAERERLQTKGQPDLTQIMF